MRQPINYIKKNQGLFEMLLAMAICGTIGITVILSGQSPLSLIFYRCLFGSLILGLICFILKVFQNTTYTKSFWIASIIGSVSLQANWYFLFSAYSKASIGIATTVYNTQPFIMVFLCAIFFKEKVSKSIMMWLALSFLGLIAISSTKIDFVNSYDIYFMGVFQAFVAAILYAIASIAAKFLNDYPPMLIAFNQMLLGVLLFLPFADFSFHDYQSLSFTMMLGIVHTGLMYIFLYGAIQKLEAYKVGSLSFLYPVLALVIDKFYFNVNLSFIQLIGVGLILCGAAGVNLGKFFHLFSNPHKVKKGVIDYD